MGGAGEENQNRCLFPMADSNSENGFGQWDSGKNGMRPLRSMCKTRDRYASRPVGWALNKRVNGLEDDLFVVEGVLRSSLLSKNS